MTNEQLDEIEARVRAASKLWFEPGYQRPTLITNAVEDLILVTHAPTDIIALIAEVRRLHTIVARINDIRRGDQNVGDVFYALEAGEISVAKAMECVRAYLTTGATGEYAHAKQDNAAGEPSEQEYTAI